MVQRQLALFSIGLLLWCSLADASQPPAQSAVKATGLRERLILIPAGSIIEVKLINKQKIRGRLGPVSDSGFEVQHARDNQIVTEALTFDAVSSVRVTGKGMHFAWKVLIGIGIVFAVIGVIVGVACGTQGCTG